MLVDTIQKLMAVIPTIADDNFDKFKPYLDDARLWLKREITGRDLYELINTASEAVLPEDATDEQKAVFALNSELVKLSELIVSHKAYYEAIPFIDLVGTADGFAVRSNQTHAPASKERVAALRQATFNSVGESVETLLEFLEEHEDYHDEWKGSPAYSMLSDTFILTVREFRRYAPFDGSRLEWIRLHPQMMNAIKLKIETRISPDLSEEIIEQLRDDDLTDKNKAILENIRFAYANFTVGNNDLAESYIARVRSLLMKTPDDYPTFKNSNLYAAILASTIDKNKPTNSIFRAGI